MKRRVAKKIRSRARRTPAKLRKRMRDVFWTQRMAFRRLWQLEMIRMMEDWARFTTALSDPGNADGIMGAIDRTIAARRA